MDYPECYRLTFCGILVAFVQLAFAYCLLCVSAFVFIASKLLVYVPCPRSGILGYQNSDLCVHKLLFEWPFTIILRIQKIATISGTRIWHQEEEEEEKKNLDLDKVRLLEEAQAALMVELEVERAASASAVDEAMAMIRRLQVDKASLEMEGKQYKREIEEIIAYDEGHINILKEILYKRDVEKHFMEKELQTHKHIAAGHPEMKDVYVYEDDNDAKMKDDDDKEDDKQLEDIS